MKTPLEEDYELIATVNAHLKAVEAIANHDADEATLRAATGALRFLLADDHLSRAWRASGIGGPMTFRAWCIESISSGDVLVFCGGGDLLPGIPMSICRGARLKEKTLNLRGLCNETRIQVGNVEISTVEFIKYFANARGGSHYDLVGKAAKKPKAEVLSRVSTGEFNGIGMRINERDLLHHEILSIAQAIVRSPEVVKLRRWQPKSP